MLIYRILADVVLSIHALFIAFVGVGLVLILAGLGLHWRWVRSFWFRLPHLVAIGIVVGQSWCGVLCPLTYLENQLRLNAGEATYPNSFIAHWVHQALFYQAQPWVFTLCYTVFGVLVLVTFVFGPPRWSRRRRGS